MDGIVGKRVEIRRGIIIASQRIEICPRIHKRFIHYYDNIGAVVIGTSGITQINSGLIDHYHQKPVSNNSPEHFTNIVLTDSEIKHKTIDSGAVIVPVLRSVHLSPLVNTYGKA